MKQNIHAITVLTAVVLAAVLLVVRAQTDDAPSQGSADRLAEAILTKDGIRSGLCVHVGLRDAKLAFALGRHGKLLVHGLSPHEDVVAQARREIAKAGLTGIVSVESSPGGRLPFADSLVNLLIIDDIAETLKSGVTLTDVLRVLSPGGVAWVGQASGPLDEKQLKNALADAGIADYTMADAQGAWTVFSKPRPKSLDQWTHPRYSATGNPVSTDKQVGVPTGVRWLAGPQWPTGNRRSAVPAVVASESRLVYVFEDEVSTPSGPKIQNALMARDAFNGLLLWKRLINNSKLPLVSAGDRVYTVVKEGGPLLALDAKTGDVVHTFDGTAGASNLLTKLSLVNDNLIAPLSDGVGCFSASTGELRWKQKLTPESWVASEQRLFLHVNNSRRGGKSLYVCLDIESGKEIWSEPTVWTKSSANLVFYQEGILVAATGDGNSAVSAETGAHLWSYKYPLIGHGGNYAKVLYMDKLVWVHSAGPKDKRQYAWEGLDPKTGAVRKRIVQPEGFSLKHRCSHDVATERYFMCGSMDFADLETGAYEHFTAARNSCRTAGVVPANGLLYSFPHACGCYAMLRGFMGLSSQPLPPEVAKFATVDAGRLQKGPAFGKTSSAPSSAEDWPTYRHDAERTAGALAAGPAQLKQQWSSNIAVPAKALLATDWEFKSTGMLSSPVVAGGLAYVAVSDRHQLAAHDVAAGKLKWEYVVGGRIDCPPTIAGGLCLFGSSDGWAYCLRAEDGVLVWRFRAAPVERRVVAFGQVESSWPVLGGVLVYDGLAYFACGRHSGSDGGVFVYAVEPATGKLVWAEPAAKLNGVADVLTGADGVVQMGSAQFDAKTGKVSETKNARLRGGRLGLLDDSWYKRPIAMRRNLQMWTADERPTGQILAFNDDVTCGYLACSKVAGGDGKMSGYASLFAEPEGKNGKEWSIKLPLTVRISGMVLTPERLYVAGQIHNDSKASPDRHVVRIYSLGQGKMLAEYPVNELLEHDCLAIAGRRLFLTTQTGKLICLGEE